ncbi:MAG: hypothetical protein ACLP07_13960 [Terracidiphilus sp.]
MPFQTVVQTPKNSDQDYAEYFLAQALIWHRTFGCEGVVRMHGDRFTDHEDESYANEKGVESQGRSWIFAGNIMSPGEREEHDKATQIKEKPEDRSSFAMNRP